MKTSVTFWGFLVLTLKITLGQILTPFNIPTFSSEAYIKYDLNDGNGDDRLILTPFIESGQHYLARKYARVDGKHFLNVTSYSGYLTVDEEHNSNLFFWFFPAEGTNKYIDDEYSNDYYDGEDENSDFDHSFLKKLAKRPKKQSRLNENNKPLVLWLQGGPGVSSLFALFTENGPFFVNEDKLSIRENPYSWHKNYSVLFIDNPVGTGFSFTNKAGYCKDIPQTAKHLYNGLVQFFKMFPMLQANDFFITGESFAGKYIPAIGNEIYEENNKNGEIHINLQGLALGNALSDPYNMHDYSDFAYQLGLVGLQGHREMKILETLIKLNFHEPRKAKAYWDSVLFTFTKHSNYSNLYDIHSPPSMDLFPFRNFVEQPHIREALHVGNQTFSDPNKVYANLIDDFMTTAIHWTEKLLDAGMRIMYYNGNWDFICAYPLAENAFQKMKWNGAENYRSAQRKPFLIDGKLKAYVTKTNNFYEAAVLNAGHMVPTDQPVAMLHLIDKFFRNEL